MHALSPTAKAQWQIHLCVVLWGFTAIFGKLITLDALPLVWWRMLLVVAVLALLPRAWRGLRAMSGRVMLAYAGIGVLVALHWLTFYASIKLANASVGATCIALATPFTALIEPKLARRRFSLRELLLGIAVLPGVALVAGGMPTEMRLGLLVGTVSAVLVALFGSLNKRMVEHGDAFAVTGLELGAGTLSLMLLAPLLALVHPALGGNPFVLPGPRDGALLVALALTCTLLPFTLYMIALRHMSAFAAQLATNLEPVYAIALAALLLGEQNELTPMFYAGAAIILAVVFVHPLIARPRRIAHPELAATAEAKGIAE
ncbi:DMT family transporter [Dokdonella sp.]|uniref:DMT family transporter n=1 Tax=Dokdonella sp. TaxID=2291710 RepID=UPI001B0E31E1|nr:DMT family transporter [Dokdonella sp.]MBO9663986.1 DMT family transporter [Dokdonella sp.]